MSSSTEGRVQFQDAALAEWLRDRAGRMPLTRDRRSTPESVLNGQAKAELGMWRAVLDAELGRIRLTLAQASCVADVLNGTVLDAAIGTRPGIVYAECYDAFRLARLGPDPDISSYGAKHGPEGCDPAKWEAELLDLLGALGPAADHALRDAICRWWADVHPADSLQARDWQSFDQGTEFRADSMEGFAAVGLRVKND